MQKTAKCCCTKSYTSHVSVAGPSSSFNPIQSLIYHSLYFSAYTGSKGALTVGGLIFTNKSKDVLAFPVLFCPFNNSPVSMTSSPPPHLSVVGLSWWAQDEQPSLPREFLSTFPSVFSIICPFFFQPSGVVFSHVLELWWWAAHMSVITCVCVTGWISHCDVSLWYFPDRKRWYVRVFLEFYVFTLKLSPSLLEPHPSPC